MQHDNENQEKERKKKVWVGRRAQGQLIYFRIVSVLKKENNFKKGFATVYQIPNSALKEERTFVGGFNPSPLYLLFSWLCFIMQ